METKWFKEAEGARATRSDGEKFRSKEQIFVLAIREGLDNVTEELARRHTLEGQFIATTRLLGGSLAGIDRQLKRIADMMELVRGGKIVVPVDDGRD